MELRCRKAGMQYQVECGGVKRYQVLQESLGVPSVVHVAG